MNSNNNETKLCKHCQSEIPKKAKVCPVCKRKQSSILKTVGIVFLVLILIGLFTPSDEETQNVTIDNNGDKKAKQHQRKQKKNSNILLKFWKNTHIKTLLIGLHTTLLLLKIILM